MTARSASCTLTAATPEKRRTVLPVEDTHSLESLVAAVRREGRWLWPVLLILGLALAGRTLNLLLTGGGPGVIPPMVVEAVLIGITLLGMRVLPKTRP